MLTVILIMCSGIAIGLLLRKKSRGEMLFKGLEKAITITIYLLLFLLGLSVGNNEIIVKNIHLIGFQALIITIFALAGSILCSLIVYHLFFKKSHGRGGNHEG